MATCNWPKFLLNEHVFACQRCFLLGKTNLEALDSSDPVLSAVRDAPDVDESVVKSLCSAFLAVCKRQLHNYLADDFTAQQREHAKVAPTHNMQSERIMAMSDSQVHRAPNARMEFVGVWLFLIVLCLTLSKAINIY